jgi:hypothetical protein
MTFGDDDSIEDDVIAALRADARGTVPARSRDRVLRRLGLGAGVLGATATVTTGAGALVASAVAAHSTTILVSTLAIGIGIGFGARSALDVIRPAPTPAPAALVAQSLPSGPPAPQRGASLAPEPSAAPPPPPVAASAPTPEPGRQPPTIQRGPAFVERAAPISALPTPVLAPPGLAAQQSLLDDARGALVRGDGTSALSAIGAHRLRFPDTAFAEERAALEIRALIALARVEEARERHAAFERAFPGSLFAPSLRKLLPAQSAEAVTDLPVSPQE